MTDYTDDLTHFGPDELDELCEILDALKPGAPVDFHEESVRPALHVATSRVFLTNSAGQIAALNGEHLETYYTTPGGRQGFYDELKAHYDELQPDDQAFVCALASRLGVSDFAASRSRLVPQGDTRLTTDIRADLHIKLMVRALEEHTTVGKLIEAWVVSWNR
jgi:hypothetical protein